MALGLPAMPSLGEEADVVGVMDLIGELRVEGLGADHLMCRVLVKRPVNARPIRALHEADRFALELKAVVTTVGLRTNNDHDGILAKHSTESHPSMARRATVRAMTHDLKFGWLSPVIGSAGSDHQAIVLYQQEHILPTALPVFDSLWIADHFYGFDARTDPFLEAWTTLTWLGAKFPDVTLCHHVLGHGYRPPALTAKMAATLQTLTGGRFVLGIGAGGAPTSTRPTATTSEAVSAFRSA